MFDPHPALMHMLWLSLSASQVGLYRAASVGDDIVLYEDDECTKSVGTLYGMRQQAEKVFLLVGC